MSELELFRCRCGGRIGVEQDFFIAAKDFSAAMVATFERFNAKTDEGLPKPFHLERVSTEFVVVGPKKRKVKR